VQGAGGDLQAAALSLTDVDSNTVSVGAVAGWLVKGVVGVGLLQAFKSGVAATMQQVSSAVEGCGARELWNWLVLNQWTMAVICFACLHQTATHSRLFVLHQAKG
jgi:hypothetical protein